MTTADLGRIEKALELTLPAAYRQFMTSGKFGEGFKGTQDLTGSADEVIENTKYLRENGFYGAKWPGNYVAIGDDGAGDYYFTDVLQENPAVLFADHELTTNKGRLILKEKNQYETFAAFSKFLDKWYDETDRAIGRKEERRQIKRWWKFWIKSTE